MTKAMTIDELGVLYSQLILTSKEFYRAMPTISGTHVDTIPPSQLIRARNSLFAINFSQKKWSYVHDSPAYNRYLLRDYLRWKRGDDHFVSFMDEPQSTALRVQAKEISEDFVESILEPFQEVFEYLLKNYTIVNELAYALICEKAFARAPFKTKERLGANNRALFGDVHELSELASDLDRFKTTMERNNYAWDKMLKHVWLRAYEEFELALVFDAAWSAPLVADSLLTQSKSV